MKVITIREHGQTHPGPVVCIDGPAEYPFSLQDPFSATEEKRLEWYFEQHLNFPFTNQVRAGEAAASVRTYGERLFAQVFADNEAYADYRAATQGNLSDLIVEIAGSPAFQRYHWEALTDPKLAQPLALQAGFVRRNLTPQTIKARLADSPAVNVLLVTARPSGGQDVAYRTIARPLLDTLRQANLRVQVHILRPGTYEALSRHLEAVQERKGPGYYHVVHFDVHGGLLPYAQFDGIEKKKAAELLGQHTYQMQRYGRRPLDPYTGVKAFLFLEHPNLALPDPVEASELAGLLQAHGIPIAVLNACQSGKQVGEQESSLGSQLMAAGVQMVLAMGYSVTVSAAQLLMREFYAELFGGATLGAALRSARMQLYNDKRRKGYYNQEIELEDWLLPVVYENRPQTLRPRPFTAEESAAWFEAEAARLAEPQTTYRFVGRDLDILEIERRLLNRRNILLLRGMGGAGKTTLLQHLAWWWQRTGFVERVFSYAYDQRAWTRQQIVDDLGRKLWSAPDYLRFFQPLPPEAQGAMLAERLRGTRHLLLLDNLESITGAELAIQHTLPADEQHALQRFVQSLAGGHTLVLLGSRGGEAWLQQGTFAENVHILGGLDPQAASELADLILQRHNAAHHRRDPELAKLIKLLDGYPLALEVVLANLARQTPGDVLTALTGGAAGVDAGGINLANPDIQKKTESILACIAYSHSNLSEEVQQLLLCLGPFTGVIYTGAMDAYVEELQAQPALARLPFDRWDEVLRAAQDWGLLAPHEVEGFLRIQPTLPYFLRLRLHAQEEMAAAVERAFQQHYDGYSSEIHQLITSKENEERQVGLAFANLEYENLQTALMLALAARRSFINPYEALFRYLEVAQQHRKALDLGLSILARRQSYSQADLAGELGNDMVHVTQRTAASHLRLKDFVNAQHVYEGALALAEGLSDISAQTRASYLASTYHQLGMVAEDGRQWAQAEAHYQRALALFIEFKDRYSQAGTYHQLGMVAQEQRQWAQAEAHYQRALAIKIEFKDRYSQAGTYHQLGMVAQEQRQWAQAEAHYQRALAIGIEFKDRYSQASTYHQLGRLAEEGRQWAQAEAHYQSALALFIEFKDRYSQASTYHQLGSVAQEGRQWAQAEAHYQSALAICIEFNDRYGQASTYHQLGRLAEEGRQWAQAEAHYQSALAIYIEFHDRYSQAGTYHQLGRVAQEGRQWAQAEAHYQSALAIGIEFNDRYSQAVTYHQLGTVAQEQRQWAQAEAHYRRARALFIEFNDRYSQASTYGQLGLLAQAQGQWAQARAFLLQALAIFRDYDDKHSMGITLRNLADLWRDSGDATLPAAAAALLNSSAGEVEAWFRQALADDAAGEA